MTADAANEERDGTVRRDDPAVPESQPIAGGPAAVPPEPVGATSEWTASDRRGPLDAASDNADVERIVPGSEVDAEGSPDTLPTHASASTGAPAMDDVAAGATSASAEAAAAPGYAGSAAPLEAERQAPRRRGSPLALVSGLVLGAIIGAGSAAIVYAEAPHLFGNKEAGGQLGSLESRVAALEQRPDAQGGLDDLRKQVSDLGGKVAALQNRATPASPSTGSPAGAPDAALAAKVATLQSQVDALGKRGQAPTSQAPTGQAVASKAPSNSDNGGKVLAAVASAQSAAAAASSGVDTLTGREKDLEGKLGSVQAEAAGARSQVATIQDQQKSLEQKLGALQTAVAAAQKDATSAQSGLGAVQTQQKSLEGRVGAPALAVVADSLVEQIEAGKPYEKQVDALGPLGADPAKVAVLKQEAGTGVPSTATLLAKFQSLADPILATGSKEPRSGGFVGQLKHGLFGLVSVRRVGQTTGDDLASRVARIEADLARNDVVDAYATWNALPASARQASASWGALAKTSVEAITAARGLRGDAIGALGTKRS